jgi:hypothetical protein
MSNPRDAPREIRPVWRWAVPAAALAVVSIAVTWAAHSLPIMCPAIYPAPASCAPDARLVPAIVGSASVVALFVLLLVAGRVSQPDDRSRFLRNCLIMVGIAAFISPIWTLSASGFILG